MVDKSVDYFPFTSSSNYLPITQNEWAGPTELYPIGQEEFKVMVQSMVEHKAGVITSPTAALVLWFEEVGMTDVPLVGGKNASLGEMIRQLTPKGINVPNGFATTAQAYRYFMEKAGLVQKIRELFADLDVENVQNLREHGQQARSMILHTPFPSELELAITQAYLQLCDRDNSNTGPSHLIDVAVRSSATAEDLPDASFAGQQETYLNVHGVQGVLESCHKCFASLFTDRAISYRTIKGFDHFNVALSVGVQKMVRSDLATSGVMFSIDTETGFKDAVLITAAYGLGETVVQGAVNPDEYFVFKPTLRQGYRPILDKRLGSKEIKMVYDLGGSKLTKNVPVSQPDRDRFALTDDEILTLAQAACTIEDHYTAIRGTDTPMDIEWAKDGITGDLFIVQARPETVQSQKSGNVLKTYRLITKASPEAEKETANRVPSGRPQDLPRTANPILVTGRAVGEMIGQGTAKVILDVHQIDAFQAGEVLVTNKTDPDWEPIMKKASAIVTNQGGRTCHAAIIAREMGIPAIVGCGHATGILSTGEAVTVSCAEGEEGRVYAGLLPFEIQETPLENLPRTRTQLLMNVGNPEEAFGLASMPCDGVGLARFEFMIANHIKAHPLALIHFEQLEDPQVKREIAALTALYDHKPDFFVDKLAHGIGMIAAAFYPKPVVVRMSDFKSNEYANLLGGLQFESNDWLAGSLSLL
jgi:pyruvate,water dikinase